MAANEQLAQARDTIEDMHVGVNQPGNYELPTGVVNLLGAVLRQILSHCSDHSTADADVQLVVNVVGGIDHSSSEYDEVKDRRVSHVHLRGHSCWCASLSPSVEAGSEGREFAVARCHARERDIGTAWYVLRL